MATPVTTLERVTATLVEQLGPDDAIPIGMDTRFNEDLGADSLDFVEIIMAVEAAFHRSIDETQAEACVTVGDLVRLLEQP